MKFLLRDENGSVLYEGKIPDEWVTPNETFVIRLDEYKSNPAGVE